MNKKIFTTVIALLGLCATMFAQGQTMKVMKGCSVVFETTATGSEKILFQNPVGAATPSSNDALILKVTGAATDTIRLDNIKEITFSGGNMSVIPHSGATKTYLMSNTKIAFGTGDFTGINAPSVNIDLMAYFNPAGNIVVKCEAGILSLTLISIDGRIVANEKFNGDTVVETRHATSLPAGVFVLRVETTQGIVMRKIINN
jgi:hypothetical protein